MTLEQVPRRGHELPAAVQTIAALSCWLMDPVAEKRVTQKDRERNHLAAFLRCIGESSIEILEEGERPDFVIKLSNGAVVGVEMTELIEGAFGKNRKAENFVCQAIRDVVSAYVATIGVQGVTVEGNNQSIELPAAGELEQLRSGLTVHLSRNGRSPSGPNGTIMEVPFKHRWGIVRAIYQNPYESEVTFTIDRHTHSPAYKSGSYPAEDLEDDVLQRVTDKVGQAAGYSKRHPLWLAIRNPYRRMVCSIPAACAERARLINDGTFARVILFNDAEHTLDASPPDPRYVDIC